MTHRFAIVSALLLLLSGVPAEAQIPLSGTFVASTACPAFQSIKRHTNPGDVTVSSGQSYRLLGENRDPPTHYLLQIPGAQPSQRWVEIGCGSVDGQASSPAPAPNPSPAPGGTGIDTADYSGAQGPVAVGLDGGTGTVGDAQGDVLTGIEVLEKFKLKIKLSQPQPGLLSLFDAYFLSGDIISPKGVDQPNLLGSATLGAGPYKLDPGSTISGKSYTYVPNEHYYDKSRIKWDKVVVQVFEDQNSAIQSMKAGQLKVLVSDPFTAHANEDNLPKDLRLVSDPVQWTGIILTDREGVFQPELKDVRVRQAINYALDRKLISNALFGKMAEPTVQMQSKGFMGYDPQTEKRYPYDPAKSKALLAEAGFPNGFELKLQYVNNTLSRFLTMAIAGQLKKVGIRVVSEEFQNFGAMNNAARSKKIGALVFNSNSGVPTLARFQTLDAKGSLNFYGSEDATLSKLIAEASLLPLDKAEASWKKVYAHVADIAWFAPVVASHTAYFVSNSVKAPRIGQSIVIDLIDFAPAK